MPDVRHVDNEREFEQTLGDSEQLGSLVCYTPRGRKELDTTKQLNNNRVLKKGNQEKVIRGKMSVLVISKLENF